MSHTVVFVKEEERWTVEAEDGDTLLRLAHKVEAPVHTLCNGAGACVQCKVKVLEGMAHLSSPNALEKRQLGNIFHLTQERLACQSEVHGDVVVEALPVRLPKKKRKRTYTRPR
ncbi:MAG: 2Fe-2S iron-sulfur cluster-binding protein [Bradymonadia bacterium]